MGFDCVFAGFLLFMLHCRCRYSDAMNVDTEPRVDGTWIESETSEFKTKNSKRSKRLGATVGGLRRRPVTETLGPEVAQCTKRTGASCEAWLPFHACDVGYWRVDFCCHAKSRGQ